LKILVLVHEFPPVGGGGGQAAKDLAQSLVSRGHQITLVTSMVKGGKPGWTSENGISIKRIFCFRQKEYKASLLSMFFFMVGAIISSLRIIKKSNPDLIHAQFAVPAGAAARFVSLLTGKKYILTAHLGDIPGGTPKKTDRWFRWIYPFTHGIWKKASSIIAVSEYSKNLALAHYPVDIEIIYNGVDISAEKIELDVGETVKLAFAGRFEEQKNPLEIVEMLETIKDLNWEFVFMGNGPLYESVLSAVKRLQFNQKIIFTGWIPTEGVIRTFESSDILVMPSLSEGLPVVGVQALAAAMAFVVSDIGGFKELVIQGENGFKIKEELEYGEMLRKLIEDKPLLRKFKERSLAHAQSFEMGYVTDQYESVFNSLVLNKEAQI